MLIDNNQELANALTLDAKLGVVVATRAPRVVNPTEAFQKIFLFNAQDTILQFLVNEAAQVIFTGTSQAQIQIFASTYLHFIHVLMMKSSLFGFLLLTTQQQSRNTFVHSFGHHHTNNLLSQRHIRFVSSSLLTMASEKQPQPFVASADPPQDLLQPFKAASFGDLDTLKRLATEEHISMKVVDPDLNGGGFDLLAFAALFGQLDVIKYLIEEHQLDPEKETAHGYKALHSAAVHGHVACIRYLIQEKNQNVNHAIPDGNTPLHFAAKWGFADAVKCLIDEFQANPVAKNNNGQTPYDVADGLWIAKDVSDHAAVRAVLESFQK